jgi:hypothetical protein
LDISKVNRVLHLSSPPYATSSLPAPTGYPYDAAAGSFRIGGAARPFPLVARAVWAMRGARNECSAWASGQGRLSGRSGASTIDIIVNLSIGKIGTVNLRGG